MLRLLISTALGGFLAKQAGSGKYGRVASAALGMAAARFGGGGRLGGILGALAALAAQGPIRRR